MLPIMVEENPSAERLAALGTDRWELWSCEISAFDWDYGQREVCYLLEGQVVVTPSDDGAPIEIKAGDLVVFPAGSSCHWDVLKAVRKRYRLG